MDEEDLHALGEALITTSARIVRWAPLSTPVPLSLAAGRLLARLNDTGPTRISELALAERCSQPTITNHVKRLETAGFVERRSDPRDARAWMIGLTPRGLEELISLRDSVSSGVEPYLSQLSRRDLKALREGVEAMRRLMALEG
ncbi:MarR family winged helix-turn-helix transcriptional regulator [uncultured Friedmanniella sp.]|uniref:MarR family winged helix-turn-helix transcriptional regulator n=1 Tax=uncultured Friedmanniella sp. TaxID=335381 RepID=UPI0035C9EDB6